MGLKYVNRIACNAHFGFLLLGVDLTWIGDLLSKYVFSDVGYLKWLMIAMFIDLITGITKVWRNEGFSKITSKGLRDTVAKCIQYGAFLIITHILTHFEINGVVQLKGMEWINKVAFEFLILIECKSVYENLVRINPKLDFVDLIINKLSTILKNNNSNNNNTPKL